MICFMDRTFCGSDCENRECTRNLTPALRERARRWWGQDKDKDAIPIAFADFKTGCNRYLGPGMKPAPDREQKAPARERKAKKKASQ